MEGVVLKRLIVPILITMADVLVSFFPSTSKNLESKGKKNCNPSQNRFENENTHPARGINKPLKCW
jgi:hypothetical protein